MGFKLAGVIGALDQGGMVRYYWKSCSPVVVMDGHEFPIDGRSYQGFCRSVADKCKRTEYGSVDARNLVIEWSLPVESKCTCSAPIGTRHSVYCPIFTTESV